MTSHKLHSSPPHISLDHSPGKTGIVQLQVERYHRYYRHTQDNRNDRHQDLPSDCARRIPHTPTKYCGSLRVACRLRQQHSVCNCRHGVFCEPCQQGESQMSGNSHQGCYFTL